MQAVKRSEMKLVNCPLIISLSGKACRTPAVLRKMVFSLIDFFPKQLMNTTAGSDQLALQISSAEYAVKLNIIFTFVFVRA